MLRSLPKIWLSRWLLDSIYVCYQKAPFASSLLTLCYVPADKSKRPAEETNDSKGAMDASSAEPRAKRPKVEPTRRSSTDDKKIAVPAKVEDNLEMLKDKLQSTGAALPKIKKGDGTTIAKPSKARAFSNAALLGNVKTDGATADQAAAAEQPAASSTDTQTTTMEDIQQEASGAPSYRRVEEPMEGILAESLTLTEPADLDKVDSSVSLISTTSSFGQPVKLRGILSSRVTMDVDPTNPRKKPKAVRFKPAGDLVMVKLFDVDEELKESVSVSQAMKLRQVLYI
jgi:hypothetical protein